ncbi:hypothetical protein BAE44_0021601 [Dichanthelium oligosanthes]|uniref:F-box protein AT5G49610-like beta-propeller domain-containing protein n=1 Tax=Dichanthelium oligosanthes TaxID=888268 RepID=A0A1E5UWW7_9POAL|nr:hypothetical protein BAE44_0021601 [Dichanthelium oligosanthes]
MPPCSGSSVTAPPPMATMRAAASYPPPPSARRTPAVATTSCATLATAESSSTAPRRRPTAGTLGLAVWDPITNHQRPLPALPCRHLLQQDPLNWNAAVLCAATADRTCDHLECHHGHFLVVFVASTVELMCSYVSVYVYVYSSKADAWSEHTSSLLDGCRGVSLGLRPCALVGSALYFDTPDKSILKYDLGTNRMSLIGVPSECWNSRIVPTVMEDGGLGFACVKDDRLHVWSREVVPEGCAQKESH